VSARVAVEYPAVGSACGWSATPVLGDGLVLLAGGGQDDENGEVALLQGLGEDGERFRVTRVAQGRSLEPAAPALLPDGDIALAVYEPDASLQVCRVSRRGEVVARDELPDDPYDVIAADLYSKLRVAVAAAGPDGYLSAWLYRQGRRQGTTWRRWGAADTGWRSDEWLLHAGADWVLGATPHPRRPRDDENPWPYRLHQEQWVCRDVVTGAERWRTDGTGKIVAGMLGAALVAVDLSAGERERCERADQMLGGDDADRVSLDGLNRSDAEPVAADSAVLVVDPASGRPGGGRGGGAGRGRRGRGAGPVPVGPGDAGLAARGAAAGGGIPGACRGHQAAQRHPVPGHRPSRLPARPERPARRGLVSALLPRACASGGRVLHRDGRRVVLTAYAAARVVAARRIPRRAAGS
jgi:hypothetical protein